MCEPVCACECARAVVEKQRQEGGHRGFTQAAKDVRLVTRLEDAWEDRLSVDVYLWRKDVFLQHLGELLMRGGG